MRRLQEITSRIRLGKLASINSNQTGAISIYISLLVTIVLMFIAMSLARITQRHSLSINERQFNIQAHYAAESALNDVRAELHRQLTTARQAGSDSGLEVQPQAITQTALTDTAPHLTLQASGRFGSALGLQSTFLAVGAPRDDNGKVFIANRGSSPTWRSAVFESPAVADLDTNDAFGAAVAFDQGLLVVGAPGDDDGGTNRGAIYIFRKVGNNWDLEVKLASSSTFTLPDQARFGTAVALKDNLLFVGAPGYQDNQGAVYQFQQSAGSWTLLNRFSKNPAGAQQFSLSLSDGDDFGSSISFSRDLLAVGAKGDNGSGSRQGAVYVFRHNAQANSFRSTFSKIYDRSNNNVRNNVDLSDNDAFGSSVLLKSGLLLVGSPGDNDGGANQGAVHIFEQDGSRWIYLHTISEATAGETQTNFDLDPNDHFGQSLAGFDTTVAIGAPGRSTAFGQVFLFDIQNNDLLGDVFSGDLDQDCPSTSETHQAWRNNQLYGDDDNIRYTCVTINTRPKEIVYSNIDVHRSLILPLQPVDADHNAINLQTLSIGWQQADTRGTPSFYSGNGQPLLDTQTFNDDEYNVPLLRVQLIVVNVSQPFSRQNLTSNSRTYFLYPKAGGGAITWKNSTSDGQLINGNCQTQTAPVCKAVFTLPTPTDAALSGNSTAKATHDLNYILRIQSFYAPATLVVEGTGQTGSTLHGFRNIQAIVTATGQTGSIYKRLRERIPLRPVYDWPEYGLDSAGDLCKLFVWRQDKGAYLDDAVLANAGLQRTTSLAQSCHLRKNRLDWS